MNIDIGPRIVPKSGRRRRKALFLALAHMLSFFFSSYVHMLNSMASGGLNVLLFPSLYPRDLSKAGSEPVITFDRNIGFCTRQ
jgi:hypothetical protein